MRILVLGARGMLGQALAARLAETSHEALLWGRAELDVTAYGSTGRFAPLRDARPDAIVNCAAWTDVDGAETHMPEAMDANANAPSALAAVTREIGAHLVHVSTDYVFDGTKAGPYVETDPTAPINVYGQSKCEGEKGLLKRNPAACVARTAWLYGAGGKNFVDTILKKAAEGSPLRVVNDQRGSPTWTRDLAGALLILAEKRAAGIFHVTNSGNGTWFDLARAIVEEGVRLGRIPKAVPVTPVTSAEFPRPARRPANSVLDTGRFAALAGGPLPPWRDALVRYLAAPGRDPGPGNRHFPPL